MNGEEQLPERFQACVQAVIGTYTAGILLLKSWDNPWAYLVWFLLLTIAGAVSLFTVLWQEAGEEA